MKRKLHGGLTSVSLPITVQDNTRSDGGGLAITATTPGLVAEYRRQGQSTWTAIALDGTKVLGTYKAGGLVADGNLTGDYEFDPPDAAVAAGARWVTIRLYGPANMFPVRVEIELDAVDYQDATLGIFDLANGIEPNITFRQAQRAQLASAVGKTDGFVGGGAGTGHVRDTSDAKNRVTATYDANGNRTVVVLDLT